MAVIAIIIHTACANNEQPTQEETAEPAETENENANETSRT